jgi:hypothetical protein
MPRIRPRDVTLALAGGAALVALVALTAAAGTGNDASATGSSFSNRPDGARAAYLTLRQLGYDVERSHEPVAAITADPAASVLVLASPQAGFSNQDRRALTAFAERGGVVLITGAGGTLALDGKVSGLSVGTYNQERRHYRAIDASDLTADAPEISMAVEAPGARFDGATYVAHYAEGEEAVVRSARVGDGRIVWWAGSTPLTNEAIAEAANLELLLNVMGDGSRAILWDEHYHGYVRSLWSYAAGTPLPWAGAYLALLAVAAMLTWSRRAGPVRPPVPDVRTSPMEFVETMGGLYRRAGVAPAAVAAAGRRLRRAVALACGLSAETPDEQLAATAAARLGFSRESLAALLREAAPSAQAPALDEAAACDVVGRLQAASARARARGRG